MIIKEIEKSDLEVIDWLNEIQKDFKINDRQSCIIDRIVYERDKPVAYGIVKKLAEAIILVDPKMPQVTRAKAMRELMKIAVYGTEKAHIDQLHCFCKDERLVQTLEHHFGFARTKDIVLVRNLNG